MLFLTFKFCTKIVDDSCSQDLDWLGPCFLILQIQIYCNFVRKWRQQRIWEHQLQEKRCEYGTVVIWCEVGKGGRCDEVGLTLLKGTGILCERFSDNLWKPVLEQWTGGTGYLTKSNRQQSRRTSERDLRTQIFEFRGTETRTMTIYKEHRLTCWDNNKLASG